jgi:regulator of replication initiation timing
MKTGTGRTVDLEPIDRLEEKITLLIGMVARLRSEQAKALEDNRRLTQELDTLRAQLSDAEAVSGELASLRGERDIIRTRVSEMLQQLEGL